MLGDSNPDKCPYSIDEEAGPERERGLADVACGWLVLRTHPCPRVLIHWLLSRTEAVLTYCRFIRVFQQSDRPCNSPGSVWPSFIAGTGFISYWPTRTEHSFLHLVRPFPFRAFFSFSSFFLLSIPGHVRGSAF